MNVVYERCAGLDVHKDTVVACARTVVDGEIRQDVRTFRTTSKELLALADWLREQACTRRWKATRGELVEALRGRLRPHHRFLLKLHLDQIDTLNGAVREVEARLGDALEPFRALEELLTTIPGVSATTAQVILSEIGTDMSRFPTAAHLISWAGPLAA